MKGLQDHSSSLGVGGRASLLPSSKLPYLAARYEYENECMDSSRVEYKEVVSHLDLEGREQ